MDTLTLRTSSATAPPLSMIDVDASVTPSAEATRQTLTRRLSQYFAIDFDLDGIDLCDDASLNADLVDLFERGDAPTARPASA